MHARTNTIYGFLEPHFEALRLVFRHAFECDGNQSAIALKVCFIAGQRELLGVLKIKLDLKFEMLKTKSFMDVISWEVRVGHLEPSAIFPAFVIKFSKSSQGLIISCKKNIISVIYSLFA